MNRRWRRARYTHLTGAGPSAASGPGCDNAGTRAPLGEVARLPRAGLAQRVGRAGRRVQRWARGQDEGLLLPEPPPPPLEASEAFEPAVEGYLPLLPWLEGIGGPCARGLRRRLARRRA